MLNKKQLETDLEIANSFEQDEYEIPKCIEYYGTPGFTVERVQHPDNLWSILDRIHSDLMLGEEFDEGMSKVQREWLQMWLENWMADIEPYCVRLESE